jgi:4-amino-4-deoxy-L-arabinose transferase-like glycosyltransferase
MRQKITNWLKNNLLLILIIIFYLGLVFYRFFAQGLINWDEAYFMVVVNTFTNIIRTFFADPIGLFTDHAFFQNLLINYSNVYTAARPSYIMPAVLINLIWPSEFASRILSALSGLLAIIFFHRLLGFYGLSKKTKAAATFLLAASPLFLIYSRLGLAQIFSAAFFLVSWYYLLKFKESEKSGDLKIAAVALSALLMSHYNTIPVVALLLGTGLIILWQKHSGFKKFFSFLFYFLLLPLAWEIITRAGALIASAKHIIDPEKGVKVLSYFQEIAQQFNKSGAEGGFSADQIFYYAKLLYSTEGIIFILLFLAGVIIYAGNIKKIKYGLFLTIPLVYLIIFSAVPLKFPRNIITILPALYVFAALGLKFFGKILSLKLKNGEKNILFAAFCLAIIALNAGQYKNILNSKTNYREIAAFIKNNYAKDEIAIFSASAPVWRVYLPGYKSETPAKIYNSAYALPGKKIIFISDYFMSVAGSKKYPEGFSAREVEKAATNIFSVKPVIMDFIYQSEERAREMFLRNEKDSITVYELTPQ